MKRLFPQGSRTVHDLKFVGNKLKNVLRERRGHMVWVSKV